eukprot:469676-Pleurochrysis_carterae.AAC.5
MPKPSLMESLECSLAQAQCSADVDAGFFPSADGTATSNVELGSCSNTEIDAETDNFPFSASGEVRSSGQAQPGRERDHHQEPTQRERRYSSALPPLIPPSSSSSPSSLSSSSSSSSSSSPSSPSSSSSSPLSSFPPSSFLSPSSTSTSPTASYTHMTFARSQLYGQLATSLVRAGATMMGSACVRLKCVVYNINGWGRTTCTGGQLLSAA